MTTHTNPIRIALVTGRGITVETVARYLPSNYEVVDADITGSDGDTVVIQGTDNAGWTLDDYVIPRLASGLLWASEFVDGDLESPPLLSDSHPADDPRHLTSDRF